MTGNQYQELALRTAAIPKDQKKDMLMHAVLGLSSEAGEVSGLLQKVYQSRPYDPVHMKKELGDCLWMIAEASYALGFTLEEIMEANIEKLKERFPDGFTVDNDINRKPGDI